MSSHQKPKSKLSFWGTIIFLIIFMLSGIGMMMYPILATKHNESVRSEVYTAYEEMIKEIDKTEINEIRAAAMAYNADLAAGIFSPLEYEENGYFEQLVLPHTDIMCYISIPKIDVYLPVYHGVGDDALDRGAGHMEQTSLPVGGANTHAVISAHTGMAQGPMFTDLELLELGDIFQVIVLGETLTYEVDDIQVVLPQVVDAVQIQSGRDMVSLVTCTPYGINSHRLIVRGQRIETPASEEVSQVMTDHETDIDTGSVWVQKYWNSVKLGALIALLILVITLVSYSVMLLVKKNKSRGNHEEEHRE